MMKKRSLKGNMQLKITIPYKFEPRPHQLEYLSSTKRFRIAVFHRRAGKSAMALNGQIIKLQQKPGIYYYFLPTYRQAKDVIWNNLVKKHVPVELVDRMNDSELAIYWKNGSIQKFVGCEDYDKHRGIDCIDAVFDEYSEMVEEVWTAIVRPILAANGGSATFCFTPKGRNHSYKLLSEARNEENNKDWGIFIKNVKQTDVISEEELEKVRRTTPEAMYNQEYMVEFLDNAGQFFRRVRENVYKPNENERPNRNHPFQLGIDLAKYNDYTVITPFDLVTMRVWPQDRFNKVDWNLQKLRIQLLAEKFNNAKCKMDRTGVGETIVADLEREGLDIGEDGAVVFTNKSKNDLLNHLSVLLEQDRIKIPDDEGLIAELEAMQYYMSDSGNIKFGSIKDMHDDRVISLALAVHNVDQPIKFVDEEERKIRKLNEENNFDKYACF